MSKVKVKSKVIKDKGLTEMFNQMLGVDSINLSIVHPKYLNIKNHVAQIIKVLKLFRNSPFWKRFTEFNEDHAKLKSFVDEAETEASELFRMNLSEYSWNFNNVDENTRTEFKEAYDKVKECELITTFIVMCDNLIKHKRYIGDDKNLSSRFLTHAAGTRITLLPFCDLNFKYVFCLRDVDESMKKYILLVLNKLFTLSYKLYREMQTPDIDVDEFVDVIMSNIGEVKKRIPRCGKAFRKIEESVALLKTNFGEYYKDSMRLQNPTMLMENFVLDVSKNTRADPETTAQFRKIISFYRKAAAGKIKDPKLKYLFDKVSENLSQLERHTNIANAENEDESSDDEPEPEVDTTKEDMDKIENVIFADGTRTSATSKIVEFVKLVSTSLKKAQDTLLFCDEGFDIIAKRMRDIIDEPNVYKNNFALFVTKITSGVNNDCGQQLGTIAGYYNGKENVDDRIQLLMYKINEGLEL